MESFLHLDALHLVARSLHLGYIAALYGIYGHRAGAQYDSHMRQIGRDDDQEHILDIIRHTIKIAHIIELDGWLKLALVGGRQPFART